MPDGRPPLLLTAEAVQALRPGSVVVDLAVTSVGGVAAGNVEGTVPGRTRTTDGGVTLIGADDLPSRMATAASRAFGRNTRPSCATSCGTAASTSRVTTPCGRPWWFPGTAAWCRPMSCRPSPVHPTLRLRRPPEEMIVSQTLFTDVTVFVLSLLVGIEVIGKGTHRCTRPSCRERTRSTGSSSPAPSW